MKIEIEIVQMKMPHRAWCAAGIKYNGKTAVDLDGHSIAQLAEGVGEAVKMVILRHAADVDVAIVSSTPPMKS